MPRGLLLAQGGCVCRLHLYKFYLPGWCVIDHAFAWTLRIHRMRRDYELWLRSWDLIYVPMGRLILRRPVKGFREEPLLRHPLDCEPEDHREISSHAGFLCIN